MKIGDLEARCLECPLTEYCTEPGEAPQLCIIDPLMDIDTDTYNDMAEAVTDEELEEKYKQYKENGVTWTNEKAGAICDIVIEKIMFGEQEDEQ